MGHVVKRGKRFQGAYRDADRKERTKTFDSRPEAELWVKANEVDLSRGMWIDPMAGKEPFRDYAERWRLIQVHRPGTVAQVETYLRKHIYPVIGGKQIGSLRRSDIQALVKSMEANLAPASVKLAFTWVSTILKAAVSDQVIARNPATGVRLPPEQRERTEPWPVERALALAEAIEPRYRATILLGLGTGVRVSEALGLTVDRVDFLRRRVKIDRQLLRVAGAQPKFGPLKNSVPRTLPLADPLIEVLSAHIQEFGTGPEGLLFTTETGRPVPQTTFSDVFAKAARPLGIPAGQSFHQLRHVFVSVLVQDGADIKMVQEYCGHSSIVTTLDEYSHLFPDHEDRGRRAIESIFRPRGVAPGTLTAEGDAD